MSDIIRIEKIISELEQDFEAIAMPRPPYVLEKLVVRERDTEPAQWEQCVLEMRVKYANIRRTLLHIQKAQIERDRLASAEDELSDIEAQLKQLEIDELNWSLTGLTREFFALFAIYQSFGKRYTRQELDAAQEEYWFKRLSRQVTQDILASGRVSVGNQDALRQIGAAVKVANGAIEFQRQKGLEDGKEKAPEGAGGL